MVPYVDSSSESSTDSSTDFESSMNYDSSQPFERIQYKPDSSELIGTATDSNRLETPHVSPNVKDEYGNHASKCPIE